MAYYIHQILRRSNFEFFYELFCRENIQDKESVETIKNIQKNLQKAKNLLEELEEILLPSQSMGRVIEKVSLNYYTVNKKKKDYPKEIQKQKENLERKLVDFEYSDKKQEKNVKFLFPDDFKSNLENLIGTLSDTIESEKFGNLDKMEEWSIQKAYENFKLFKAKQKSNFLQFFKSKKDFSDLKNEKGLCLMNDFSEENFNKFVTLTNEIQNFATQKSSLDKSSGNYNDEKNKHTKKIKEKAQQRGKHFSFNFKKYKKFNDFYKNIAVELGFAKAKIKALEKEQVDAERVKSWAVILEEENQKYICTIPRDGNENLSNAKKFVDGLVEDQDGKWKLCFFESLTLRALDKLCFGKENNTFAPKILQELFDNQETGKCNFFGVYFLKINSEINLI